MPGKFSIFNSVGRSGANLFGDVTIIQRLINLKTPERAIDVDGLCGPATISAIEAVERHHLRIKRPTGMVEPSGPTFDFLVRDVAAQDLGAQQIAWGARVSAAFKSKLIQISQNIGVDPNFLISAMAFETGETFTPSIKNSTGATGLIQFTPATAIELGTGTDELAAMTAEDQMDYVEKYFDPYKNMLETVEDVYMAILWPAAIGKPNSWVLFSRPSPQYDRNSGLDTDKDGNVTKEEAAAMVRAKLRKGRGAGYFG
jgi:hypothetical protein